MPDFVGSVRAGRHPLSDPVGIRTYGRKNQAGTLAAHLSNLVGRGKATGFC
jgi:hypothetical protein